MGRRRGFGKKKDKFDSLPSGFKEAIQQSSVDEIKRRISDVAILDCTMKAVLKQDPEVANAREKLKNLMSPYREDIKSYKLQIEWMKRTLDDKNGGATTAKAEENVKAALVTDAQKAPGDEKVATPVLSKETAEKLSKTLTIVK